MRTPLVIGNWKMNGDKASVSELINGLQQQLSLELLSSVELGVCPPSVYLSQVAEVLADSAILVGSQDVCQHDSGAFTGEVAASMLLDLGCYHTLVGHSERRALFGETDDLVAAKVKKAVESDLMPIVCVGESLEQREAGRTLQVIDQQLSAVIDASPELNGQNWVVAYEPVWAIGTGLTASPEQAQEVHAFIRERVAGLGSSVADTLRILYGGSVKADNAKALFSQKDIDGGLIGGASLNAKEFIQICQAAIVS